MSSKSILIILSYTVETQCIMLQSVARGRNLSFRLIGVTHLVILLCSYVGFLMPDHMSLVYMNIIVLHYRCLSVVYETCSHNTTKMN